MPRRPRYSEAQVREAVESSPSLAAALRRLGLRPARGNHQTIKKLIARFGISTDHLNPKWALRGRVSSKPTPWKRSSSSTPLMTVGTSSDAYTTPGSNSADARFAGQGETWRGRPMALILDHVNGVPTYHRVENLRIVCPNCAAPLETIAVVRTRRNSATTMPPRRRGVHPEVREPQILLARLRHTQQRQPSTEATHPQGPAPAIKTTHGGPPNHELPRHRPEVRCQRYRHPQMDPVVRG